MKLAIIILDFLTKTLAQPNFQWNFFRDVYCQVEKERKRRQSCDLP